MIGRGMKMKNTNKIVEALKLALAMATHEITSGTQGETPCVDAAEVHAKCLVAISEITRIEREMYNEETRS